MDLTGISNSLAAVIKTFESNPLIPLIASGGITVWLISNIKAIFSVVSKFVLSLVSFSLFNTYEDARNGGYSIRGRQHIFNSVVTQFPTIWERTMNLDFSEHEAENKVQDTAWNCDDNRNLTYGFSIKLAFGKLVLCNRTYRQDSNKIIVNLTMRVFFASKKKFVKRLNDEITSKHVERLASYNDKLRVFYGSTAYGRCSKKEKRDISSIFTNNDEHIELYEYIRRFLASRDIYKRINYPYKLNVLLSGKPGSGKSSTILAIASMLRRDVEYVNLANTTVMALMDTLNDNTGNRIFVFEDIDALHTDSSTSREDGASAATPAPTCIINNDSGIKVSSISLSDLLNITDGLLSSDGSICIFTTNHIEKLDPALIRAGRMNKIVDFGYLTAATADRMIREYIGHGVGDLTDDICPAELQEDILNVMLGKCGEDVFSKYLARTV